MEVKKCFTGLNIRPCVLGPVSVCNDVTASHQISLEDSSAQLMKTFIVAVPAGIGQRNNWDQISLNFNVSYVYFSFPVRFRLGQMRRSFVACFRAIPLTPPPFAFVALDTYPKFPLPANAKP